VKLGYQVLIALAGIAVSACGGGGPTTSSGNVVQALPTPTSTPNGLPTHKPAQQTAPTSEPSGVSWSISPIDAVFSQDCHCTDYQVTVFVAHAIATTDWTVSWSLALSLVDPKGAPDPQAAGSGAALDAGCNNNGAGTKSLATSTLRFSGDESQQNTSFTWYHPDAAVTPPGYAAGTFHCNHRLQGPRGHQGIVVVLVSHGVLICRAEYQGTHSGMSTDGNQFGGPTCYVS
jgi:hypothetical protein